MSNKSFDRAQQAYDSQLPPEYSPGHEGEPPPDAEQIQFDRHGWKDDIQRDDHYSTRRT